LANEEPLTAPKPATLKQMINDVKARHEKELDMIYDFQARERMELLLEQRAALDGGDFHPNPEIGVKRIEGTMEPNKSKFSPLPPHLWAASVAVNRQSNMFSDTVERFNLTFFKGQLLPLHRKCAELENRLNTTLPTSLEEFKESSHAHQVRVAKLLTNKGPIWPGAFDTPATLEVLQAAYKNNPDFQSEVQRRLESIKSVDPRRNPGNTTKLLATPKNV
ncbi:hypothetical protein FRC16_006825, partial [Serendipita sp. 398]